MMGDSSKFKLPHPSVAGNEFDFSFSGLKTSVINMIHNAEQKNIKLDTNDLSASIQKAISDILTEKTINAAKTLGYKKIALAGGVQIHSCACNARAVSEFEPTSALNDTAVEHLPHNGVGHYASCLKRLLIVAEKTFDRTIKVSA